MTNPNDVFTNLRYIAPTQSELQALLLQSSIQSPRAKQLAAEKLELQARLDAMTAAFELLVGQYNEAVHLLDVSTTALEELTIAIVEGAQ
ncbi:MULTISPECIES: hypothetical protein [Pseudomonas]|uniref:hypothetical protein n=1 Tax=Pseudomonas TaxID=286 RepID=UPI0015A1EC89|nr:MULTISPECIES: hypothetical protein [Pseudomonas]MBJ2242503.1 hypothetical protein [Pseudomonas sp. MF6768]NWF13513.1 hypothetical protein [Pseudomonas reactans]